MKKITLIVAACVGLFAAPAPASLLGLEVTTVDFSNGYVMADGSILSGTEHIGPIWQKAGVTTYRVWVQVSSVTDAIALAGSGPEACQTLILQSSGLSFINAAPFGGDSPPNALFFDFAPNLGWDSFVTIGGATSQTVSSGFTIVDPLNDFGGISSNVFSNSARWLIPSPSPGSGVVSDGAGGWRILIAQLSVLAGETISGKIFVQDQSGQSMILFLTPEGPPNLCPADIAPMCGNATVDLNDIIAVLDQFGPCGNCSADITPPGGNGVVNIDDLVAVLNNFGPCP